MKLKTIPYNHCQISLYVDDVRIKKQLRYFLFDRSMFPPQRGKCTNKSTIILAVYIRFDFLQHIDPSIYNYFYFLFWEQLMCIHKGITYKCITIYMIGNSWCRTKETRLFSYSYFISQLWIKVTCGIHVFYIKAI